MNTTDTLLAFGEWLDSEGLVKSDSGPNADKRTHEDLAKEFIEQWEARPNTAPLAGKVPQNMYCENDECRTELYNTAPVPGFDESVRNCPGCGRMGRKKGDS